MVKYDLYSVRVHNRFQLVGYGIWPFFMVIFEIWAENRGRNFNYKLWKQDVVFFGL